MGQSSVRDDAEEATRLAVPSPVVAPASSCHAETPELDCLRAFFSDDILADAAHRAAALGTGADRVMIAAGLIDEPTYLKHLALRSGIRRTDLTDAELCDASGEDLRLGAQSGMLRMRIGGRAVFVTTLRGLRARRIVTMALDQPREANHLRLTTEQALQDFLLYRTDGIIAPAIHELQDRYPALSAAPAKSILRRAARKAMFWLGVIAAASTGIAFPVASSHVLALVFLAAIGLRFAASLFAVRPAPQPRIADGDLPDYTIIAALYHEANSVPQLLAALTAIDYPREKLDIILVVETDDLATRAAIARCQPPSCVRVIVAPDRGPRTKPKALNVALPFARGAYVAVFDAEDKPEPDQLRMALAAFKNGGDNLACVQARLAIDNAHKSFFTRMFAAEYAGQFDVTMPGYDRLGVPWPLGGTSNHFRAHLLREACAWDPFNVTEDADLGLRFARFRFRTATIASTTWEEAPVRFVPWLKQRTRWMKGWMQTWAVHGRHPRRYGRRTGWRGFLARDLLIGGALLAALAYPLSLLVAALMLADYVATGETAAFGDLFSPLHLASFGGGLAVSILIQARGLACRGRLRDAWVLAATPFYWACLSVAAWRALFQLRKAPYKWEKTAHGSPLASEGAAEYLDAFPLVVTAKAGTHKL